MNKIWLEIIKSSYFGIKKYFVKKNVIYEAYICMCIYIYIYIYVCVRVYVYVCVYYFIVQVKSKRRVT